MRFLLFNRIIPLFTFFPVVFALAGYLASLLMPMTIELWEVIFFLSIALCLGVLIKTNVSYVTFDDEPANPSYQWWKISLLILIPMLVMIPGLLATFVDTKVQTISHADFHSSLLNQIIHGTFPPVSPQIPDLPIGYYWLYHAILAVPTHLLSLASPMVSASLNLIALICTLFWAWLVIDELEVKHKNYLIMGAMVMIFLFSANLFGVFHAWDFVVSDFPKFSSRRAMLLDGGDPRLYGLWSKYLNYNSTPISLLYYVSGILAILRLSKGQVNITNVVLLSFGIVGGVIFLFTNGFFLVATVIPALALLYLIHLFRNNASRSLFSIVPTAIQDARQILSRYTLSQLGITLAILVFLFGMTLIHGLDVLSLFPGSTNFSFSSRFNLQSLVNVNYPLIPFILITVWLAFRKRDSLSQLLVISTALGTLVAYVFVLSDNNQYKFVLLNSLLVGLMTCRSLYWLMFESQQKVVRWAGYSVLFVMMGLIWVNMTLISLEFINLALDGKQTYEYDGRYIMGRDSDYKDTFIWIRNNTPTDTLIIQPLEMEAFYTAMYTERLPYLGVYQFEFSKGITEYDDRLAALELFFNPASTLNQRMEAVLKFRSFESDRSLLLAVPHALDIPSEQVLNLGFSLAYEADNTTLYWLRQNGQFVPMTYLTDTPQLGTIFTFGDESISLQGIDMADEQTIEACESFWVTTWWQTSHAQDMDYLMKLVLIDAESGQPITNSDAIPSATLMTQWLPDTLYTDTRILDVPCDVDSGEYLLLMGIYEIDFDTLEFVADLSVFYQGASQGNLGFLKSLIIE